MQLNTICKKLRQSTASSAANVLYELSQLVGGGIRVSYEVIKPSPANNGRGAFAKAHNAEIGRVMLTVNKNNQFGASCQELAGIVLEYGTWKAISVPPKPTSHRFRVKDLIHDISQYRAYEIRDGTVVTLYYYGGEWRMSSANGYDVSEFKWMGRLTYMEAFLEAAGDKFSLDMLDQARCYTVGFRHHEMHPMRADPEGAWLIRTVDLEKYNAGEPAECTDSVGELGAQKVVEIPTGPKLRGWLTKHGSGALSAFIRGRPRPPIYYGVILRGPPGLPDIVLESDLLSTVRNMMYNFPKNCTADVDASNRASYMTLCAVLKNSNNFLALFPQYRNVFKDYENAISDMAGRTIRCMITGTPIDNADRIDAYAQSAAMQISRTLTINPNSSIAKSVIIDYFTTIDNVDEYFALFA